MTQEDYFLRHRTDLMKKILIIFMIIISVMVIIRYLQENIPQAMADLIFLLFLFYSHLKLKSSYRYFYIVARVICFGAVLSIFFLLIYAPQNPMRFIWFSTIIYMLFYLFPKKEGTYWIIGISLALLVLVFFDKDVLHLSLIDFSIWVLNVLMVLMIANWYAKVEEKSTKIFLEDKEVLEKRVKIKTRALERLNAKLELRIAQKIEINREQEEILFKQARFVQMGEMISMIADQWKKPLHTIATTSTVLQIKIKEDKYEKTFFNTRLERITLYVQNLSSTIEDFRNFFKFNKEKEEISFCEIIQSAKSLTSIGLEDKNIVLEVASPCTYTILSYKNEILQVLLNLIKNAEDALMIADIENPKIILHCYILDNEIIVEVSDNAGGIEEEILPKIFEPYFTTKEKMGAIGLGLYMSKVIIEEHCDGKLTVENQKNGAVFKIVFNIPIWII